MLFATLRQKSKDGSGYYNSSKRPGGIQPNILNLSRAAADKQLDGFVTQSHHNAGDHGKEERTEPALKSLAEGQTSQTAQDGKLGKMSGLSDKVHGDIKGEDGVDQIQHPLTFHSGQVGRLERSGEDKDDPARKTDHGKKKTLFHRKHSNFYVVLFCTIL